MTQKTYSIGFHREDGDFQLLATLNNNDELLTDEEFESWATQTRRHLEIVTSETITILERQDAPDYVTLES